jgi:hypothetical protein
VGKALRLRHTKALRGYPEIGIGKKVNLLDS